MSSKHMSRRRLLQRQVSVTASWCGVVDVVSNLPFPDHSLVQCLAGCHPLQPQTCVTALPCQRMLRVVFARMSVSARIPSLVRIALTPRPASVGQDDHVVISMWRRSTAPAVVAFLLFLRYMSGEERVTGRGRVVLVKHWLFGAVIAERRLRRKTWRVVFSAELRPVL